VIRRRGAAALATSVAAVAVAGCLFRSAEAPRFYRPAAAALDDPGSTSAAATGAALRVGSVHSAPFLRERVVWRSSSVEYGLYDQRRWFELPSRYVRRALIATLEKTPGIRLVQDPQALRLDVEVLAFDEVLAPVHEAHVALVITLRDGAESRLEHRFVAKAPIANTTGAAMAEAMGRALDEATRQAAAAVAAALGERSALPTAPRPR
jgi:ABC-type uncharacterized transport system auxiliary subunit